LDDLDDDALATMRHGEPGDPPSFPRLRGRCPECDSSPCRCEDLALEEFEEEGGEG
jgi:hypothetical protein